MRLLYNIFLTMGFYTFIFCGNFLMADAPIQQPQPIYNSPPVINVENGEGGAVVAPGGNNAIHHDRAADRRADEVRRHNDAAHNKGKHAGRHGR